MYKKIQMKVIKLPKRLRVKHSGQTWGARAVPAKTFAWQSLKFSKIFAFESKVKTVAEKLSFILRIWLENLLMDIFRDSQLVIFSHSTIFITLPTKLLQVFLFKLLQRSRRRTLPDFCVWPQCGSRGDRGADSRGGTVEGKRAANRCERFSSCRPDYSLLGLRGW